MSRTTFPRALAGAGMLAAALTIAACGGDADADNDAENGSGTTDSDGASNGGGDGELIPVTIGYFPLVHTATVVHALESGYFEDEGLDVELGQTGGGATAIPSIVTGEYDISYANYTSLLLGAQQGLPLTIIAGNDVGVSDHGIMVMEDSDLGTVLDLQGATVAVNNLSNIGTVAIYSIVDDAGGDSSTVDLVELPYPEMLAALERGDVDAAWQVEPFQAFARAGGARVLVELFSGPVAEMPVAGWGSTVDFVEQNPEAVEGFRRAMARSVEDLSDNRERLVELVPSYTEVSAEVVQEVAMPRWTAEVDVDALVHMEELMLQYGVTETEFDVTTMIAD